MPLAAVGQTAIESAACGDVVVVVDDVVVELTDVVLGVAGLPLLPHAATTIDNPSITDPARRWVATAMMRTYRQPGDLSQGPSSRIPRRPVMSDRINAPRAQLLAERRTMA
jgi:hypothetical protein